MNISIFDVDFPKLIRCRNATIPRQFSRLFAMERALGLQNPKLLAKPVDLLLVYPQSVLTLYLHLELDVSVVETIPLNLLHDPLLYLFIAHLLPIFGE